LSPYWQSGGYKFILQDLIKPKLGNITRVGFPAVLGYKNTVEVVRHLESTLGIPVFEIGGLPLSIPGIRLHNLLISAIENNHGEIYNGLLVLSADTTNNMVTAIISDAAARQLAHNADNYVLATGGVMGGGITTNINGYAQEFLYHYRRNNKL
jgi:glycerol-3-phosphate dehydrogenase subunit B